MENNDYIYIVLVKALTGLGKFSRKISKYEYTHIAVCLDDSFNDFITFSRKKHYAPFDAGFMHEKIEHYAFGKNKEVKLKIFKVPVDIESKRNIEQYINKIANDNEYIFNLYSMITMPIIHGIKIYKALNCMSFVSKIVELSNSVNFNKEYYKYSIKELDELLNKYFYVEKYFEKQNEDYDYMKKIGLLNDLKLFFELNIKLLFRILLKR